MKPAKIGLALSGGGARGLAHIGVLKVLQAAQVPIGWIGGTSMGGVIAAAYACGVPVAEIEARALRLTSKRELMKLVDLTPGRRGLLDSTRVRDFLCDLFLDRTFETLPIPLALTAVDLDSAREVVFTSGLVFPAVLASIAVPGIFAPVRMGNMLLVDGGVLNNLPVDRVRSLGAPLVVAVDAQFDPAVEKPWQQQSAAGRFPVPAPDFFLDFYRAELIMVAALTQMHLKENPPDVLLRPPLPPGITMVLGFQSIPEIISAGEECARAMLPRIQDLIDAG